MIDYTHPHAEKIHQETLSILQHAPSAARLLEQAPPSPRGPPDIQNPLSPDIRA
ncbi:MAG: hypothetical protein LRY57_04615 [Alphaproteobacteria bacterium]|nr:hypothetical protein [Alphaproteobacteria bacterium]